MEAALAHLNLLDGREPSHAAVLLFGRDPQRFLLTSEVKCLHFHGTEVRKPIPSYQIYKGTVFELVDQALDFVMSKIARRVGTRALGPVAPVDYELPREAVAEAIVNAVAHRHYTSNASVQVMLFTDRLEVWTRQQLQRVLGLKDDEHFRKAYLQPALDAGLIEMTIPNKPRSSRQKYRLTAKGAKKGPKGT